MLRARVLMIYTHTGTRPQMLPVSVLEARALRADIQRHPAFISPRLITETPRPRIEGDEWIGTFEGTALFIFEKHEEKT
jgi:hypothetical protein